MSAEPASPLHLTLVDDDAAVLAEALDLLFDTKPDRRAAIADLLTKNRALLRAVARAEDYFGSRFTRPAPNVTGGSV